jgi:hypothetical protein
MRRRLACADDHGASARALGQDIAQDGIGARRGHGSLEQGSEKNTRIAHHSSLNHFRYRLRHRATPSPEVQSKLIEFAQNPRVEES